MSRRAIELCLVCVVLQLIIEFIPNNYSLIIIININLYLFGIDPTLRKGFGSVLHWFTFCRSFSFELNSCSFVHFLH